MTTRRGLFGFIAGALGLAAGIKAAAPAPEVVFPYDARTFIGIDPATAGGDEAAVVFAQRDVDGVLHLWDSFRIEPAVIYCNPSVLAEVRATLETRGFDLFGIRRRALAAKYWREYEADPVEDLEET